MKEPDPSNFDEDDLICKCMQVRESVIREVIARDNLEIIEHVTTACEAGGGCHSCHILIQLFLDEFHDKHRSKEELVAQHGDKVTKKGILSTFFSKFKTSKT